MYHIFFIIDYLFSTICDIPYTAYHTRILLFMWTFGPLVESAATTLLLMI